MFSLSNLHIGQSRTLLYIYSGVHLLALYAVFISSLPPFHTLLFFTFVLLSMLNFLSLQRPLSACSSIVSINWSAEQASMQLIQGNGVRLEVFRLKQKAVTPFMVCLLCEVEERFFPVPVIVFRDACTVQEFRRLRVLALHASVHPAL